MASIRKATEGCVITHLCLHLGPDFSVDKLVASVPLLRHVEFLVLCQYSMTRSKIEELMSEHFGNLRRLVVYNLYNCTNWQKFLSIPAIQKLVQLEIYQKSAPDTPQWERRNVLFTRLIAVEDEFFRYCFNFSRLCKDDAKLVTIDAVFTREFIERFIMVS